MPGTGYVPASLLELLPILARARRRAIKPLLRGIAMRSPGRPASADAAAAGATGAGVKGAGGT